MRLWPNEVSLMSNVEKPVKSPCISICALDEEDVCQGCYRTAHEITQWTTYTNDERRQVMVAVLERAKKKNPFLS